MDQALEIWATEADCSEISLDGVSDFARVWVFSAITSVGLLIMLIVPFVWCRKRAARVVPEGIVDESPTGATKTRASEVEADLNRSEPDLAAAKRHLVRSSATVDGKWLSPCSAGLDKMCVIGGTGTSLYFGTLRSMGYLFATMAAITFPTMAFCLLGTFAPDNGQFLARTTIGNLGLYVDTQVLDPLLRIVRVNCDGASLSNLTAVFAWLDFAAVFILFVYLVRFRFYDIPKQIEDDDLQQVSVSDFSVLIEKLPARIPNQRDYERLLTEHLESRMRAVQNAHGDKKNPQVCEVTLVRDFKGRLDALQEQARLTQQIEVQKAYHNERKLAKLTNKKAKLDQKIEMQLPAEEELPVLRAFVILNRVADVDSLLYDYRLAKFSLFRCCQSRRKRFCGHGIRVIGAPQPTEVLWENQDVPWWSRLLRQICMLITFVVLLVISLICIYVITVVGKSQAGNQLSYIGSELCDPVVPETTGNATQYICYVNVAANWTKQYAVGEGGDILNCWCESMGYAALVEDPSLFETCSSWLLELGKSMGIMTAASTVVVVINLVLQWVFIAMAKFERSLSNNELNYSMMQKIFLAQTLNLGFVLFTVNTYGPRVLRDFLAVIPGVGNMLMRGPFSDINRGWYVVVGATILTNLLLNMFMVPGLNVVGVILSKFMRCCCRGRVKHHSELVQYYTNPEFDLKTKYAQLLTTVCVTLIYSSGLPLLYLIGFGYMALMYWADKITLLWYSKRPPHYDAVLAKNAAEAMLYAVALHCIFAVVMFGQPCVFPSQSLGGDLGSLIEKNAGEASSALGAFWPRLTQESTWMFVAFFAVLLAFWVIWWLQWAFAGTFGAVLQAMWALCCASHKKQDEDVMEAVKTGAEDLDGTLQSLGSKAQKFDVAEMLSWEEAKALIEKNGQTSSYHWWEHPDQIELAHHMKGNIGVVPQGDGALRA